MNGEKTNIAGEIFSFLRKYNGRAHINKSSFANMLNVDVDEVVDMLEFFVKEGIIERRRLNRIRTESVPTEYFLNEFNDLKQELKKEKENNYRFQKEIVELRNMLPQKTQSVAV